MFKLKITFHRHNARQKLNYLLLSDPRHFSLPSTFEDPHALFIINMQVCLIIPDQFSECSWSVWAVFQTPQEQQPYIFSPSIEYQLHKEYEANLKHASIKIRHKNFYVS